MALLNIVDITAYRFSLPFISPMRVGAQVLHHRSGFLIELTDDQGKKALGEVAPLPGLDSVRLDACRKDIKTLRDTLINTTLNTDDLSLTSYGLGLIPQALSLTHHALTGLEGALLALCIQNGPCVCPDPLHIPVNGLFIPESETEPAFAQARFLKQNGFKTVKVKIGRLPVDQELRQILALADTIGNGFRLRLDGNRSLSTPDYARFYSRLKHLSVDYVEEPLRDGEPTPPQDISWPIALDESLLCHLNPLCPDVTCLPSDIRTVILKPGLLPGLSGMAAFIDSARKRRIQTVLSSSFNTGVGLAMLGLFWHLVGLPKDVACGFDTLRYLQADVISGFPVLSGGALSIPRTVLTDMHLHNAFVTKEDL